MARQKQQGESLKSSQSVHADMQNVAENRARESQGSFVDALNATQQHTVPILPAHAAPPSRRTAVPPETQHTTDRWMPETPSGKKAKGDLSETCSAGTPSVAAPAFYRGCTAQHHADAVPANAAIAGEAEYEDQDLDLGLTPGRPTFVLPAIADDRLPSVRPPLPERQLTVQENEEPRAVFIRGASKLPTPRLALAPRRHGPRPFIVQFLVAMVTVMTLSAVLTLASPLGKGLAFSNGFQAYANAMPWIPTPTPTPKPTPAPQFYGQQRGINPGQQVIIDTIKSVFGSYSTGALNVARCESDYDPNAYNSYPVAGSHAEGVFQILYPSTWSSTSYAQYSPYDYHANIRAAYEIFHRDGNSWREWECRP